MSAHSDAKDYFQKPLSQLSKPERIELISIRGMSTLELEQFKLRREKIAKNQTARNKRYRISLNELPFDSPLRTPSR